MASEKDIRFTQYSDHPNTPVIFHPDVCNGCNHCVEVCQVDVYIPNPGERQAAGHPASR